MKSNFLVLATCVTGLVLVSCANIQKESDVRSTSVNNGGPDILLADCGKLSISQKSVSKLIYAIVNDPNIKEPIVEDLSYERNDNASGKRFFSDKKKFDFKIQTLNGVSSGDLSYEEQNFQVSCRIFAEVSQANLAKLDIVSESHEMTTDGLKLTVRYVIQPCRYTFERVDLKDASDHQILAETKMQVQVLAKDNGLQCRGSEVQQSATKLISPVNAGFYTFILN